MRVQKMRNYVVIIGIDGVETRRSIEAQNTEIAWRKVASDVLMQVYGVSISVEISVYDVTPEEEPPPPPFEDQTDIPF